MGEGDKIEASLEDDTLPLTDIVDPRDTDVLCGRGGAALRHPGNQTYRRLVHLNKGLYITCLKAEKLKISRSIVAAIREQNGRFLERDTKKGTWLDIGDKKAMEKTSQALREGQPKLRQKIVELGGGAAGAAALLETQFPGGSMYQISQATANANNAAAAVAAVAVQQQQQQQQQVQAQQQQQVQAQLSGATPRDTLSSDMLQRLSLTETTIAEEPFGSSSHLRASLTPAGSASSFGIERSNFSLMSDISSCGIAESALSLDTNGYRSIMSNGSDRMPPPAMTPGSLANSLAGSLASAESMSSLNKKSSATGPTSTTTTTTTSSTMPYGLDRRKYFARMKYSRPASGRFGSSSSNQKGSASQRSLGTGGTGSDGMPDIHLVESSPSLFSGMSGASNSDKKMDMVPDVVANVFESRRSIMSGLSRISDTSEVNSIFSDLSKKIGNVSTRSIAMSEISDMDGRDESHFDHIHHTTTSTTNNNNNNDHHLHKLPTVTTSMNHHLQMEE